MNINDCKFTCSTDGKVALLTPTGDRHEAVRIVRAFPFTAADGPVAIVDSTGHEIIWIKNPDSLSLTHRQFIQSQLEREEFLPRIHSSSRYQEGHPVSGM